MAILAVSGCAGMGSTVQQFLDAPPWWLANQANVIRQQAEALESEGELALALERWRVVRRITLGVSDAAEEIARLEKWIADAADDHYRQGMDRLRHKDDPAARRHFLAALRLDPDFQPALSQIKARFSPFPLTVYRTNDGETLPDVAEKIYGDKAKAYIVAWFNDLSEDASLAPGTLLMLPKSDTLPVSRSKPKPPATDDLTRARRRLAAGDLDGALAVARKADNADPAVRSLIHTIQLKKAQRQIDAGRLDAAEKSVAAVPDDTPGKSALVASLQASRQRYRTSRDLAQVRTHLEQGRYREGLDLAQRILDNHPDNPDARQLVTDARYRLALDRVKKNRFLDARDILAAADPDHASSMHLKARVHEQLLKMAQSHYRTGVKHFINEDLKAAIAAWEQALTCNPEHEKARENIDNARHLLKKIETMP